MSSTGFPGQQQQQQVPPNLKQELQNELTAASQLLWEINTQTQHLKQFTQPGGQFETSISQSLHALDIVRGLPGFK